MTRHWSAGTLAGIEHWSDVGLVLRAAREPWLVIDPKPFVDDPAYDATQHLFNCPARMRADPGLWMFARAAAEPRECWDNADSITLARAIAG
jgi:streptomycin 6-kinase